MTIVDRGLGQAVPAGNWEAVFYQATHDRTGLDVGFAPNWPFLRPVRGAYHFARPHLSSGHSQADLFCQRVLALGWNATSDLWALDIEEGNLSGSALYAWIVDFMEHARAVLGDRGFLYIGWWYHHAHVSATDTSLLSRYRWWLPDYGRNDGVEHGVSAPASVQPFIVLHQYSSNPFDKSSVVDRRVWDALFATQPAPPPKPPVTIDHGDKPVKTTDVTRKLDDHGRGYFDLPAVKNPDVLSFGVIGVPDPDQGWEHVRIPVVAFTLSAPEKTPRFVITGGAPNQTVTVRVTHL